MDLVPASDRKRILLHELTTNVLYVTADNQSATKGGKQESGAKCNEQVNQR